MAQVVWFLFGLGLGLALDWVLVKLMLRDLKERVKALESVIELDSAQKMERVLALESRLRLESEKVQELVMELRSAQARVMSLESDLERVQSKYLWKE